MAGFRKIALDLSEFFDLSLDMMCIATPQGDILACNQAFLDGGNRTAEEVAQLNYISLIHPDDLSDFMRSMERMARGEAIPLLAFRYQHKDGHYIHSEWSCQPREGLLYASGRDVTQRVESEVRLAEATQRYQTLARLAPVGIFLSDTEGRNLYSNQHMQTILGMGAEKIAGYGWISALCPDRHDEVKASLGTVEGIHATFNAEHELVRPDGDSRWIRSAAGPVRDSAGNLTGYIGVLEDITERRLAQDKLEAAKQRYETLARLAPVGIFLSAVDGDNVYANEKLREINELKASESDGLAWMDRIHPEDRAAFTRKMQETVARRNVFRHEYRLKMPDGRVKWVQSTAEPQFDSSGAMAGYIGTVEDITQRRQARHLMSLAGRIAKIGGWELDVSTQELEMSDEILAILEAPPGSAFELDRVLEVYAEPMRAEVKEKLRQAMESGKPFDYEAEITTFKGTRKYIHVAGETEMADGRCVRLSGVIQDITERMAAKRSERAANDKLRLLFERAPLGLALHRLGGEYVQSNPAYGKILGMTDEQARGTNALEMILPEYADAVESVYKTLMDKRSYGPIRTEMRRPDGSTVLTVSNGVMVRDANGDEYVWSMVEDITLSREIERTRAEHERELETANRALQESNREIEEFTYAASHDLKEPLRTIIGFCELLEEDVKAGDAKAIAEDMRIIRGGATRMQRLVNDLLALSRSGKQVLNIAAVPLDDCVRQAKVDLGRQLEQSMADLQCDDMPVVSVDAEHVTRVLQNLIGNALKYQPKGRRPVIRITAVERDGMCEVRVSDNGIGIDAKYHDKVFEAFKRLHGQSEYEGSGIGLAICRKTIERHGGTIRVESEPGNGSTFIFTLPLAEQLAEVSHG